MTENIDSGMSITERADEKDTIKKLCIEKLKLHVAVSLK